jgi:hypothetical protein
MDASKKFGRHLKEQKGAKHMRASGASEVVSMLPEPENLTKAIGA